MMRQGFAVLVLALIFGSACTAAPRPLPPPDCPPAARPAHVGPALPVGDGLTAAELGFSRVDRWSFSIGAIVANPSSRAAYRTTVTLRLLDAAGLAVLALPTQTLPVVLPGSRLPVGASIDLPAEVAPAVARVSVELGTTHWVDSEPDNRLFIHYDTVAETDHPDDRARNAEFRLPANMGSGPCRGLSSGSATLVYRNPAGAVIGGETVAYAGDYCAGSHFGEVVSAAYVPLEADRAGTLIAVYCDA
ncbi:hypothetical protein [Dactylosporangium matsuzakiense]|nr:hypothetical protein [Dactylosporangium matsuzakiense]